AVFAGYVNWTCNGRSVLPMVPALGILLMRRIEDASKESPAGNTRWMWLLLPAAAAGLAVAWADFCFANAGRTGSGLVTEICRPGENGRLFLSHWGFQYYMQQAGAKPVDIDRMRFRPNMSLVIAQNDSLPQVMVNRTGRAVQTIVVPVCPWL